jgi:hypothetical protein
MFGKNIANYSTFNTLLVNRLEIQNSESGLIIYSQDPNNPEFSFSTAGGGDFKMSGSLTVSGDASFESINISEFEAGLIALSATNTGDTLDIGLYGKYDDGTEKYSGIARDANDTYKRWTFFKDIETMPTTTVAGIDSTKLDSVRMDRLFINNGTASNPSLTFHNDVDSNTGLYLSSANDIGISADGANVLNIRNSGGSREMELNQNTELKLLKFGTADDITSANPAITTGNMYLYSSDASDKWFKYYSVTSAPTPAYSGSVYTSPSTNFFMFNSGSALVVARNAIVASESAPPDYRNTSTDLLTISASQAHFNQTIRTSGGSVSAPGIVFSEANTGIYRNNTNQISIANNGSNSITFAETAITSARLILYPNGSVSSPAFGFSAGTQTGLYRDTGNASENISVTASGVKIAGFQLRTTPQFTIEAGGSASIPSLAWRDYKSGLYSPSTNQLGLSLNESEVMRFRPLSGTGSGDVDLLNSLNIKSDGIRNSHIFDENHLITNSIKATGGSFHGYNLADNNIIAIYSFRSDDIIGKDYSTGGNDLTAVNSPTVLSIDTDGNDVLKKDVLNLAGNTNKYLQVVDLTPFRVDRMTISFWFRITGALSADNVIMSFFQTGGKKICIKVLSDSAPFPNALQLTVESDALTTLEYHTATSADPGSPSIISVKDNLWHHVVYTIGTSGDVNTKAFMYYDGAELDVSTSTLYTSSNGDNGISPKLSTNSFDDLNFNVGSIGALYNGVTASEFFTGYLKDIYFTNRHISTSEVDTLGTDPFIYFYGIDVARLRVSDFSSSLTTLSDGSASLPSLSFSSDLNTGIYKAGSDIIGLSAGGAGVVRIGADSMEVSNAGNNYQIKGNAGTASLPTYSFTSTNAGIYSESSLTISFASDNVRRMFLSNNQLRCLVSIHSDPGSIATPAFRFNGAGATGLYYSGHMRFANAGVDVLNLTATDISTPNKLLTTHSGSASAPSLYFSETDTNTGLYRSAEDEISVASGGVQSLRISSTELNYRSIFGIEPSTRKITLTATSGDTGPRFVFNHSSGATHSIRSNHSTSSVTLNYLSYYLYDDAFDADGLGTHLVMRLGQTGVGSSAGLLTMFGVIRGHISGSASNPIYSFVGATQTGMFLNGSSLAFSIAGTERLTVASSAVVTSSGSFKTAIDGSAGAPAYRLANSNTGIYGGGNIILFSTNGTFRLSIGTGSVSNTLPIRSATGSISSPSYTFTDSTDSGLYLDSVGVVGLSCGNQSALLLRNRSNSAHSILNSTDFRPDGTNIRLLVENTKLRASSNQTILPITPVLYLGFKKNISLLTEQDESINKIAIISSASTYTTAVLDLTDANGVGLLNYGAVNIGTGNRVETATFSSILNLMTSYEIVVKFKPINIGVGTNNLFEVIGNTSNDLIRVGYSPVNGITLLARTNSGIVIDARFTTSVSVNVWYSIKLTISGGNSLTLNGASPSPTYTTGNAGTSFPLSTFSTNAKAIVGGAANSFACYYSDFYIAPIATSESANSIFRTQAHEIYTNKIQYGSTSVTTEGSLLRADAGNNLVWDSSIQITPGTIQINNSKVLRLPNGTAGSPAYSFSSDPNSGIYGTGSDTINFSTGGTEKLSISSSVITASLPISIPDGTSLSPSIRFSSNPVIGMYLDGLDWHFNGTTVIFNNGFLVNSTGSAFFPGSLNFGEGGTSAISDPAADGNLIFSSDAEEIMRVTPTDVRIAYSAGTTQLGFTRSDGGENAGRLFVDSSNDFNITANSGGADIRVNTNSGEFIIENGTDLRSKQTDVNTTASGANVNVNGLGLFAKTSSSIRYKKNIEPYTDGLNIIDKFQPITYRNKWKTIINNGKREKVDDDEVKRYAGLIAEDLDRENLKLFVSYNSATDEPDNVEYSRIVTVLINSIKELNEKIKVLESQIPVHT